MPTSIDLANEQHLLCVPLMLGILELQVPCFMIYWVEEVDII
jgi:hypothetical protein